MRIIMLTIILAFANYVYTLCVYTDEGCFHYINGTWSAGTPPVIELEAVYDENGQVFEQ